MVLVSSLSKKSKEEAILDLNHDDRCPSRFPSRCSSSSMESVLRDECLVDPCVTANTGTQARPHATDVDKQPATDSPKTKTNRQVLRNLRESIQRKSSTPLNVEDYSASRKMTKAQEIWNAISMTPPTIYCFVYLLMGDWTPPDSYTATAVVDTVDALSYIHSTSRSRNINSCLDSPNLRRTLPPLPVLAVMIGTALHMPCSVLYHWNCAYSLDARRRVHHWSRRLDQIMIHFAAALFSYGSSGSVVYFVVCTVFNLHCMYILLGLNKKSRYQPRNNQARVGIAIFAYGLPLLIRRDYCKFLLFWCIVGISMWLFSQYPLGGWSHCAFHLAIGCVPVILIEAAKELPESQPQHLLSPANCIAGRQFIEEPDVSFFSS